MLIRNCYSKINRISQYVVINEFIKIVGICITTCFVVKVT